MTFTLVFLFSFGTYIIRVVDPFHVGVKKVLLLTIKGSDFGAVKKLGWKAVEQRSEQ